MIEIDPQDRLLRPTERRRSVSVALIIILLFIVAVGVGIFYWQKASYTEVYKQLNITALPLTVELQPGIYNRLGQLSREPCYRDAIIGLSDALLDAGYPRESANSVLAFVKRCGGTDNVSILTRAYIGFKKVSDYSAAIQIADQLVNYDPADPQYRYDRGATYEQLKNYSAALADYIAAL